MVTYLRLYAGLAACSLLMALAWQQSGMAAVTPAGFGVGSYRHLLGTLDGRDCPSYPVCSLYASRAFHQHGMLIGSWLMLDRLIHEGDDLKRGPWVVVDGEERLFDPLSRNTAWFDHSHSNLSQGEN
jgi:putative component of membrane protein insertase Oxa1/YidC/SpoIIIJ protein YidD